MSITTKLTKAFNLKTPIVSAPMASAAGTDLVQAVQEAGGLGLLPVDWKTKEELASAIETIRDGLKIPVGAPLPFGLGYIVCMLDAGQGPDDARLAVGLSYKPACVLLAFSDHMKGYPPKIRALEANSTHKTKIIVTVNSLEEARIAVYDWKVDVINIQGHEAGGHSRNTAPPLHTFVQTVFDHIPPQDRPIVTAAGGVCGGKQIAALLTMGVDGVVVGCRFLATHESIFTEAQKEVVLAADFNATVYNTWFDEQNSQPEWPKTIGARNVINLNAHDYNAGVPLEERKKRMTEGIVKQDKERLFIWAGPGIGFLKKKEYTKDIIRELNAGAIETLKAAHSTFAYLQ
jgi:nitronate monooxygenase